MNNQLKAANEYCLSTITYTTPKGKEIALDGSTLITWLSKQDDGSYTKDLARNILTEILPYLGIYPTEEITEEERQSLGIQVEKEGGDTQWVSQYVYDDYGNLMYDETTWEPLTEMVEVDENGNVVLK